MTHPSHSHAKQVKDSLDVHEQVLPLDYKHTHKST